MVYRVEKIVSGGQSGVDRGALEAAIRLGIPHGGWCPLGRLAEDGTIADKYNLQELDSSDYADRTEKNVLESDGTLVLYRESLQGGTLLTHRLAKRYDKPVMRVRLDRPIKYSAIRDWLAEHSIRVLNIAGPRESSHKGVEQAASTVVESLFTQPSQLRLKELADDS